MEKESKEEEKAATAENKRQDELLERDLKRIETQAQREDRVNADFAAARQAVIENDAAVVERGEAAITEANERSQEKIREEWEKTKNTILDVMAILGDEADDVFGNILSAASNAAEGIAAAFSGDVAGSVRSFFNFVSDIGN
ncbi:MAG: hypothetical protein IIA03_09680, partial [Proteobacteria bacterium]|nr:hypothetical protein [Pseudomonadota bacterium]